MNAYLDEAKNKIGDHTTAVQKRIGELRKEKKQLQNRRDHLLMDRGKIRDSLTPGMDPERRKSAEVGLAEVERKMAEVKATHAKVNSELNSIVNGAGTLLTEAVGRAAADGLNGIMGDAVREAGALLDGLDALVGAAAKDLGLDAGATLPARQRIGFRRERLADFSKGLKI